MRHVLLLLLLLASSCQLSASPYLPNDSIAVPFTGGDESPVREHTTFQTSGHWKAATDIRSDLVMVYGADDRPGETFL
jgi:hypothetical protein